MKVKTKNKPFRKARVVIKRGWRQQTLFSKTFWSMIGLLAISYITLQSVALYFNYSDSKLKSSITNIQYDKLNSNVKEVKESIMQVYLFQEIFEKTSTKTYLENRLSDHKNRLDSIINSELYYAFSYVESSVDKFLDYHYSVIGEYQTLAAAATHDLENMIQEKLLSHTFHNQLKQAIRNINVAYIEEIKTYTNEIESVALQNVDQSINEEFLTSLYTDIKQFENLQFIKLSTAIAVPIGTKIIAVVGAKIAAKLAIKTTAKASAKFATSGLAALGGVVCGPFAPLCGGALAVTAWFGTDAVVVSVDEYYNRDELKQEIINMIMNRKDNIASNLSYDYDLKFNNYTKQILNRYKQTKINVKAKIKDYLQ